MTMAQPLAWVYMAVGRADGDAGGQSGSGPVPHNRITVSGRAGSMVAFPRSDVLI
jgi:hypothetical protein